jgi:hypothetical protein
MPSSSLPRKNSLASKNGLSGGLAPRVSEVRNSQPSAKPDSVLGPSEEPSRDRGLARAKQSRDPGKEAKQGSGGRPR